jgi:hypothetical protein
MFDMLGWKRLLLADGPRQSINALILYSFWKVNNQSWDPEDYLSEKDLLTSALFLTMMFTVVVFAGSVLLLIVAAFCYVPLLCYIQGNLKVCIILLLTEVSCWLLGIKEYCCHKVDKVCIDRNLQCSLLMAFLQRIAELIKRKNKLRLRRQAQLARKEAAGDFSHLKDKNGQIVGAPLQPTLPDIDIDDELEPTHPVRRGPQPPFAAEQYWGPEPKGVDGYSMHSGYAPSQPPYYHAHNGRPDSYYDAASDYGSTAHLAPGYGQIPPVPMGDPRVQSPGNPVAAGYYVNDPRLAYPEQAQYPQEQFVQNQAPQYQAGDRRSHASGLAYDEPEGVPAYPGGHSAQGGLPSYDRRGGKEDGHGGGYAM